MDLTPEVAKQLGPKRLLWVDIDLDAPDADAILATVGGILGIRVGEIRRDRAHAGDARLTRTERRIHLTLQALEIEGANAPVVRREIDLIAEPNVVISLHAGTSSTLGRYVDGLEGETLLGALNAGELLSSMVDEVIDGYFLVAELIEREIDVLDHHALHGRRGEDVLGEIVRLRARIAGIRRVVAPHRQVLSTLALPEMRLAETVGPPWPGLVDHFEAAMGAIENLRESLIGTFDIHMSRESQRANDVMRTLTLLSAILLPAVVLAGIMGMNFKLDFFDTPANFGLVIAGMVVLALSILGLARWRNWL